MPDSINRPSLRTYILVAIILSISSCFQKNITIQAHRLWTREGKLFRKLGTGAQ